MTLDLLRQSDTAWASEWGAGRIDRAAAEQRDSLLSIALEVSVPLYVRGLQWLSAEQRAEVIRGCWAEWGTVEHEALMYRSKPGESKRVFNLLTRAIAALSFEPGGIWIFGRHWESHVEEQP